MTRLRCGCGRSGSWWRYGINLGKPRWAKTDFILPQWGKLNFSVRIPFGTGTGRNRSEGRRISIKMVIWTSLTANIVRQPDILRRSRIELFFEKIVLLIPVQVDSYAMDFGDLDGDGVLISWWGILRDYIGVFEFQNGESVGRESNFSSGEFDTVWHYSKADLNNDKRSDILGEQLGWD